MPLTNLLTAIMQVGDCGPEEAKEIQDEMVQRCIDGEDPEDVLTDEGLEPDFVIDLINLFI